ncbi:MAG: preprotein translocase subunit SecG [Candidatus Omnitrophica bacterium CG1_02_40_15]|nr:MAG: preprotein translocase subunit SecG [Candidatus Omnitrophica bacterium CG1_02_40_15]
MYSILTVVHVIISLFLIAVILLQAGKGGGLADTFGGSQMQNLFGTKSTTVLTKLTAVCAIGFIVTCISLALMSSHQARSIVDNARIPRTAPVSLPHANSVSQAQNATPQAQVPAPAEPAQQGGASEVK